MNRGSPCSSIVRVRMLASLAGVAAIAAACGGAESGSLGTAQTSRGSVLAGPSGKTLYVLVDSQNKAVPCSGQCGAVWPPLTVSGAPQAGSGVSASLATTSSAGNAGQVTANGMPVYYYSGDGGSGDVNGQGINSFGGTWYAVQPNGQPMTSGGGTNAPTSSPSSGGGY